MLVEVEIRQGPQHDARVTQQDIQRNIDALRRAASLPGLSGLDYVLVLDSMSILQGIQTKLPRV